MNTLFVRFASIAVFALCAFASPQQSIAGPMAENEAVQIRNVIVAQLAAFADDDADKAFETATPGVREAIGNSNRFLAMVRGAYPMVYRPMSVSFLKPEEDEGTVLQLVEIKDDHNKSWLALFSLERQSDATWRIGGCIVTESRWKSV